MLACAQARVTLRALLRPSTGSKVRLVGRLTGRKAPMGFVGTVILPAGAGEVVTSWLICGRGVGKLLGTGPAP